VRVDAADDRERVRMLAGGVDGAGGGVAGVDAAVAVADVVGAFAGDVPARAAGPRLRAAPRGLVGFDLDFRCSKSGRGGLLCCFRPVAR
jgi:hypothetical protein